MKVPGPRRTTHQRLPKARSGRATGQALVEMAIVFMLMMTLVIASIDFGVYLYRYVQAANCVREAARRAVVRKPVTQKEDVPYCVDSQLPLPTMSPSNYDALNPGDPVTASIDVPYDWLALDVFIPGLTGKIKVSVTMRMEGRKV